MTAPLTPGPDDRAALSSQEQAILAGIVDDLTEADPALARRLGRRGRTFPGSGWPVSPVEVLLLVLVLLLVVVVASLQPAWTVLAPATVLLVGSWVAWCVRGRL